LEYPAIVPGAAPDEMNIDMNTRPEKVKTYALYFNNSNGYNQSISSIALKSSEKIKVLAVGPSSSENADTYLVPHLQEDGSYLISSMTEGLIGVAPKSVVKPIYVTLSGVEDAGSTLQFSTYDDNAQVISNGTIILSNPISKVQDIKAGFEPDAKIHSIVPNPASGIVTINISAYNQLPNVKFRIVDIFGNEVISLLDGVKSIEQGEHIYTIDVAKITSGMYYLVLQTPDFTISEQISIVR
jgi:hypothetical protein